MLIFASVTVGATLSTLRLEVSVTVVVLPALSVTVIATLRLIASMLPAVMT